MINGSRLALAMRSDALDTGTPRVEALFVIQKGPSAGLLSGITMAVSSSVRRVLRIGSSSLLHCPEMACCIGAMISLPDIATSAACGCNPVCNVWVKIS